MPGPLLVRVFRRIGGPSSTMTAIALTLTLTGTACSGSDDTSSPPTTDTVASPPTTAPPSTAAADPTTAASTSPPSTDAATTTATAEAPPTTQAIVADLVITAVADLPGRYIEGAFTDGTSIIAFSRVDRDDPTTGDSIARLDLAGNVVQDVDVGQYFNAHAIRADERTFIYASYVTGGSPSPFECGLREIDLATLSLGPMLLLRDDLTCGGAWAVDDVDAAIVWFSLGAGLAAVAKVDTRVGTVTQVPIGDSVPTGYDPGAIAVLDGVLYVELEAAYDADDDQYYTAPDGSPLPDLLLRLDPAVGPGAVVELAGSVDVVDGQLVAYLDDGRVQLVDPTTLATTDTDPATVVPVDAGASWGTSDPVDPTVLAVGSFDAAGSITAQGSVETGFPADGRTEFVQISIGPDLYVLASSQTSDQRGGPTTSQARLYQVAPAR